MTCTYVVLGLLISAQTPAKAPTRVLPAKTKPSKAKPAKPTKPAPKLTPAQRYDSGVKAYKAADYVKAVDEFVISLAALPQGKTALYLGNAYLKLGQLGKAKEALAVALKLEPQNKKRATIVKLIELIDARDVGTLQITSTPPGVNIRVDDEKGSRGKTPMDSSLPPGSHRVFAELEDYETVEQPYEVASDENEPVSFTLRALECALSISATPPATVAAIDDAPPVALPANLTVKSGPHQIALTADAFEPKTETVTCDGKSPLSVQSALVAVPVAVPVAPEPTAPAAATTTSPAPAETANAEPTTPKPAPAEAPKTAPVETPKTTPVETPKTAAVVPTTPPPAADAPVAAVVKTPAPADAPVATTPASAEVVQAPPAVEEQSSSHTWVWVVVGVGVAAAAGAATYFALQPRDPTPTLGSVPLGAAP